MLRNRIRETRKKKIFETGKFVAKQIRSRENTVMTRVILILGKSRYSLLNFFLEGKCLIAKTTLNSEISGNEYNGKKIVAMKIYAWVILGIRNYN